MPKEKKYDSSLKFYAKYSSLGLQMIVIIVGAAFGGREIDKYVDWEFPVFTVSLTILSVILAVIYGMRGLFKEK